MSGGSSANNSWTILTPEETAAETLRPLAEGTEHGESLPSAAGSGEKQPANGAECAEELPAEGHLVPEEVTADLNGDTSAEQPNSVPPSTADAPAPASLEVSGSFVPDSDAPGQPQSPHEGLAESIPDPDSFSDSYSHVTPSPDEPPAAPLSTETLAGGGFAQEEEQLTRERTLYPLNGEELLLEGEGSDLSARTTDLGKQADSPVDYEVGEERLEKTGEEGEPAVRRRRSLLAALERIGRTEVDEEGEEEFQLPQREDDGSGFSVNKCILGAVILLGLGTIFFSGLFMDLDEESDYGARELKDTELPGKQDWLSPEVPPPPVDADGTELLNKLAKGNQQVSILQAQLQAQKEELKVAKGQAAEGAKERLRWEEVEKENSRLKKEMASLPVLQKENARMKKELEPVPALQKEVETLRSTVTELKLSAAPSTAPSGGQPEDSTARPAHKQPWKAWDDQGEKKKHARKDRNNMGEKQERKERERYERKEGETKKFKEWGKAEKYEHRRFDKEKDKEGKQRKHGYETKQGKEKDLKKDKSSRGDEGKTWKAREGKKDRIEKTERKQGKEDKDWKRAKHEKVNEGKQWRDKEEKKDWKLRKDHGEKHKSKEEWKGEREWKKGKDGFKESGKEKWERKDWKEKGEKKEWKKEGEWKKAGEWKSKNGKEGKGKGERRQWEERKTDGKERKGKDERKQWNEDERRSKNGKDDTEWKRKDERKRREIKEEQRKRGGQKEKSPDGDRETTERSPQEQDGERELPGDRGHEAGHLWGEGRPGHTHRRAPVHRPEYWALQRERLRRNPGPARACSSAEECARAEGRPPVLLPDFEAVLHTYLAKAAQAGVDGSIREELEKLAAEFFKDGVFVHDQLDFHDFVEDLGDILEDMVEVDDSGEVRDGAIEDEMEEFEREAMKRFPAAGEGEKEERAKGEWRAGSARGRG